MFCKRRTCRGVPLVEYVHARMVGAMLDRDEDILLKVNDRKYFQGTKNRIGDSSSSEIPN
jgi:hypothetical protein